MLTPRQVILGALASVVLLAASCWTLRVLERDAVVVIGCLPSTQSRLLAEILAAAITRSTGRSVATRTCASTGECFTDLHADAVQLVPVSTGPLLSEIFGLAPEADPQQAWSEIAERTRQDTWLAVGPPLGLDDRMSLAMRREQADRLGIRTISDLLMHRDLRLGGERAFLERPDGWPGLVHLYRLRPAHPAVALQPAQLLRALHQGQVDLVAIPCTDPALAADDARALIDDRAFFPADAAALMMRRDLVDSDPAIAQALADLDGRIDDHAMSALNAEVDIAGRPIAAVARDFVRHLPRP